MTREEVRRKGNQSDRYNFKIDFRRRHSQPLGGIGEPSTIHTTESSVLPDSNEKGTAEIRMPFTAVLDQFESDREDDLCLLSSPMRSVGRLAEVLRSDRSLYSLIAKHPPSTFNGHLATCNSFFGKNGNRMETEWKPNGNQMEIEWKPNENRFGLTEWSTAASRNGAH